MNAEITLPLETMTVAEKLQVMELIWEDLAKNPSDIPSPEWHAEFLRDREKALADGTDRFIDWDEAERLIREEPHESHSSRISPETETHVREIST